MYRSLGWVTLSFILFSASNSHAGFRDWFKRKIFGVSSVSQAQAPAPVTRTVAPAPVAPAVPAGNGSCWVDLTTMPGKEPFKWRADPASFELEDGIPKVATNLFDSADGKIREGIALTDEPRERNIRSTTQSLIWFMMNGEFNGVRGEVPDMRLIPATGITMKKLRDGDYDQKIAPLVEIGGLGPEGILRGTMLLPTSAHAGPTWEARWANCKKFAVNDKYSLVVTEPGKAPYKIVDSEPSLALITTQEFAMKLVAGQEIELYYDRTGTEGKSGFYSGRVLFIRWDGT